MVSPILAHISLHYVLDGWCTEDVKAHGKGQAILCRYADDFVCAFRDKRDAERCYRVCGKRLGQYGRELSPEHTRLLGCRRHQQDAKSRLDFLGLTFVWGRDRTGQDRLPRRTARSRLKQALSNGTAWIKQARNQCMPDLRQERKSTLRGYDNDYGGRGNAASLAECFDHVERLLDTGLHRRSHTHSDTWQGCKDVLKQFAMARPRMTEPA